MKKQEQKYMALKVGYAHNISNKLYQVYRNLKDQLDAMAPTHMILPDNVECTESHFREDNLSLENKLDWEQTWQ